MLSCATPENCSVNTEPDLELCMSLTATYTIHGWWRLPGYNPMKKSIFSVKVPTAAPAPAWRHQLLVIKNVFPPFPQRLDKG